MGTQSVGSDRAQVINVKYRKRLNAANGYIKWYNNNKFSSMPRIDAVRESDCTPRSTPSIGLLHRSLYHPDNDYSGDESSVEGATPETPEAEGGTAPEGTAERPVVQLTLFGVKVPRLKRKVKVAPELKKKTSETDEPPAPKKLSATKK